MIALSFENQSLAGAVANGYLSAKTTPQKMRTTKCLFTPMGSVMAVADCDAR